jgi:hypothetical protein
MMEQIEAWLMHPTVRNFVFTHPFITWGLLAAFLSACMLIPLHLTWPKKRSKKSS